MKVAHEVAKTGMLKPIEWLTLFKGGAERYSVEASYANPAINDDVEVVVYRGVDVIESETLRGDFFTLEVGIWFGLGILASKFRPAPNDSITVNEPLAIHWLRHCNGDPFTLKKKENVDRMKECDLLSRRLQHYRHYFVCDEDITKSYYDELGVVGKHERPQFRKQAAHCKRRNDFTKKWKKNGKKRW